MAAILTMMMQDDEALHAAVTPFHAMTTSVIILPKASWPMGPRRRRAGAESAMPERKQKRDVCMPRRDERRWRAKCIAVFAAEVTYIGSPVGEPCSMRDADA